MLSQGDQTLLQNIVRRQMRSIMEYVSESLPWPNSDSETAINQLVEYDVEITIIDNYKEWLRHSWGVVSETQMNRSEKFISAEMMDD